MNEYLKLAANADKQQLLRIKAVFEKKNQKSAHSISQLQKKLDGYHKRIKNWEVNTSNQPYLTLDLNLGFKERTRSHVTNGNRAQIFDTRFGVCTGALGPAHMYIQFLIINC